MKAIIITNFGGPEVLHIQERTVPEPGAEEVRVRVHVAGLNRADIMQREGQYPAPPGAPADIPGLEFMGTVDAVGSDVRNWQVGSRVFGLVAGGAYAEYIVTNAQLLVAIPDNLSDIEAGAVPEVFMTAHDALFGQAKLLAGEGVLVHAVGSGVGLAVVQLAKAAGAICYGTARSPEKLERAMEFGLDAALPLPDFLPALNELTAQQGVNVAVDFVGGAYFRDNIKALAICGRLVQVGALSGVRAHINLATVMSRRLQIIGTVLRSRSLEEKVLVTKCFASEVVPLLERGTVKPVVDRVFPFHEAVEAHRYLESNASFGKVLLQVTDE